MENDDVESLIRRYLDAYAKANGPEVAPPHLGYDNDWFVLIHPGVRKRFYFREDIVALTETLEERVAVRDAWIRKAQQL